MSYEGYSQFLCKYGHYWTLDCYTVADKTEENLCPICGQPAVWENMVDVTNGSFEVNPETLKEERIDGYVELQLKQTKICKTCGTFLEVRYHIPRRKKGLRQ